MGSLLRLSIVLSRFSVNPVVGGMCFLRLKLRRSVWLRPSGESWCVTRGLLGCRFGVCGVHDIVRVFFRGWISFFFPSFFLSFFFFCLLPQPHSFSRKGGGVTGLCWIGSVG